MNAPLPQDSHERFTCAFVTRATESDSEGTSLGKRPIYRRFERKPRLFRYLAPAPRSLLGKFQHWWAHDVAICDCTTTRWDILGDDYNSVDMERGDR